MHMHVHVYMCGAGSVYRAGPYESVPAASGGGPRETERTWGGTLESARQCPALPALLSGQRHYAEYTRHYKAEYTRHYDENTRHCNEYTRHYKAEQWSKAPWSKAAL
jgi:hypothetical protein